MNPVRFIAAPLSAGDVVLSHSEMSGAREMAADYLLFVQRQERIVGQTDCVPIVTRWADMVTGSTIYEDHRYESFEEAVEKFGRPFNLRLKRVLLNGGWFHVERGNEDNGDIILGRGAFPGIYCVGAGYYPAECGSGANPPQQRPVEMQIPRAAGMVL